MTDATIAAILRTVRLGFPADRAALAHGITPATLRSHRKRHRDFATALKKAEAEAEASLWSRILKHSEKMWVACAWLLERRWPERYAKREHVDVSTRGDAKKLLDDLQLIRERNEGEGTAKEKDGSPS